MKKILITGGAGFIGSKLANVLALNGNHVRVMDNLSEQIHGSNARKSSQLFLSLSKDIEFLHGDVCSMDDWLTAIRDIDYVYHFAAETGTGQSMYEIRGYTEVNIKGTTNLLDVLVNRPNSVSKIVLSSSRAVYGEGKYFCKNHGIVFPSPRNLKDLENGDFECRCPICFDPILLMATDEDSKLNPSSFYGVTKLTQELLLKTVCESMNIPLSILRFQNVYGPGQSLKNPYTGILSIFSTQILNGKNINIYEDGLESRDFVYVEDVVKACILALDYDHYKTLIVNVGTGKPKSVFEVASKLLSEYTANVSLEITGDFRLGDIRHNYADISKAVDQLNYQPLIDFEVGIKKFCDWVKSQPLNKDTSEEAKNELRKRRLSK